MPPGAWRTGSTAWSTASTPRRRRCSTPSRGVGYGYEVKTVGLECETGSLEAFAYYATHIDAGLKPFC